MELSSVLAAIGGGALIGLSASLVLLAFGRVAGIAGIVGSLLGRPPADLVWRVAFLGGMAATGVVAAFAFPQALGGPPVSLWLVAIAGVLVGYGTRLGSGCTSGHGVCGLARFSKRSLAAVMTFMVVGAITVAVVRALGGWS